MATITNPTVEAPIDTGHTNSLFFDQLPILADDASVNQYCTENGYTLSSYTKDEIRFSNDGGRAYNYWKSSTGEWINCFGYEAVVATIVTT